MLGVGTVQPASLTVTNKWPRRKILLRWQNEPSALPFLSVPESEFPFCTLNVDLFQPLGQFHDLPLHTCIFLCFQAETLLRVALSSSACGLIEGHGPSFGGPLSLLGLPPNAVVSVHSDLRLRFLYINKHQYQCVKTLHSDSTVTRFSPHSGFNKTSPYNLR